MNTPIDVLETLRELVALRDLRDGVALTELVTNPVDYWSKREAEAWARARELTKPLPGTVTLTIAGEPASKANSREIVLVGKAGKKRPLVRKSDKALDYEDAAALQIPAQARARIEGPVRVTMRIFYASERPDLDESVILDVLQDRVKREKLSGERYLVQAGVYRNDRQVRQRVIVHGVDRDNPRAEITVEPLQPQQAPTCANEGEKA